MKESEKRKEERVIGKDVMEIRDAEFICFFEI